MTVQLVFHGKENAFYQAQTMPTAQFVEQGNASVHLTKQSLLQNHSLIRADNLETLRYLHQQEMRYHVIYIDPPYNSNLKSTYNDSHGSPENWLAMMAPRLVLARNILSQDGVLFVSIDDRECASLTLLLREIFGDENHVGTIKWRKKRKPSFLDKHFSSLIEYVLVFAKDKKNLTKLSQGVSQECSRPVLNRSNALGTRILRAGTPAHCPDGIYAAGRYLNKTLAIELKSDAIVEQGKLKHNVEAHGPFRVNQEILDKSLFITKKFGLRRFVLPEEFKPRNATDDATGDFESNEDGETQLRNLFSGKKVFDFPKPTGLIQNLIKMYNNKSCDRILCLDFFAGSGTLAHAVYELNLTENKYVFCCVQNEEKNLRSSDAESFETIADIAQARIQAVEKKYHIFPTCKVFTAKT